MLKVMLVIVSQTNYYQHGEDRNFVATDKTALYKTVGKSKQVVSMNEKYHGFVKSNGFKQIKTLTNVELSDQVQGKLVTLSNVNTHPIFESPSYTQYPINRLKYYHAHDKDLFMIDGAVKKTVGGQLYYHVTST